MPAPSEILPGGDYVTCRQFGHRYKRGRHQCPVCKGFAEIARHIDLADRELREQLCGDLDQYLATRSTREVLS